MSSRKLDLLHSDHALVARFEDVLGRILAGPACFDLDHETMMCAIAFIELFVHGYHCRREDDGLFATLRQLQRKGMLCSTFEMHDHQEFVEFLRRCRAAAFAVTPDARARLVHELGHYLERLRDHRILEDSVIFPQIEHELTDEQIDLVNANIERVSPCGVEVVRHSEHLLECLEACLAGANS